jgi:hypothetical protein
MRQALFPLILLLAGCGDRKQAEAPPAKQAETLADNRTAEAPALPPAEPIPPGRPGGLPDDRAPIPEAPYSESSAQGAANVVQIFYALVEQGRVGEAKRLWSDPAEADRYARGLQAYREYHAQIGAPGTMEGAAGSSYVEVPIQAYGRLKNGDAFSALGTVTLRRVNDVPGSTAEQRKWHIVKIEMREPAHPPGA